MYFRLDFDQFKLLGPETVNNVCNNDQFIVSGGNPVPSICGINMGNHSEYFKFHSDMLSVFFLLFFFLSYV